MVSPSEKNDKSIHFYPNPVSNILNVKVKSDENREFPLTIYNSIGTKVYHCFVPEGTNHQIDDSGFAKGIYVIQANSFSSEKLIIN